MERHSNIMTDIGKGSPGIEIEPDWLRVDTSMKKILFSIEPPPPITKLVLILSAMKLLRERIEPDIKVDAARTLLFAVILKKIASFSVSQEDAPSIKESLRTTALVSRKPVLAVSCSDPSLVKILMLEADNCSPVIGYRC